MPFQWGICCSQIWKTGSLFKSVALSHQLSDPIVQQDLVVNRVMTLFNRVGGDGIFAKDGWNDYQLGNDTVILSKSIKRLIVF